MTNSLLALYVVSLIAFRRSAFAVLSLFFVGGVTFFALVGLLTPLITITVREVLFLSAMNLVTMAIYFELISPSRDEVPKILTSSMAIFGGIVASLNAGAIFDIPVLGTFPVFGAALFLLMIVGMWFWFDIVVLQSFKETVEEVIDTTPIPDVVEPLLFEEEEE